MGWKTVRERYAPDHIVKVEGGEIHVGTAYVGSAIVVSAAGVAKAAAGAGSMRSIADVVEAMNADPQALAAAVSAEDSFERSLPVHACEDGRLLELSCEAYGWPNVTHDGRLMYENVFFADPAKALAAGLADASARVRALDERLSEAEAEVIARRRRLAEARGHLASLAAIAEAR